MQSQDRVSSQIQNSEMIQFPQPTRPTNSYNFETPECPPKHVDINFEPVENHYNHQARTAAGDQEEKKETLEEVLELIAEWYEKLPASIRNQLNLRILKGPSDKQKGFRIDSMTTRGVNGPVEEMKLKLERFKIRTVQQGGVVQEDEQDKK